MSLEATRRLAEREGDLAGQLRARLLAGEVTRERVALAAWLGYAPALKLEEPVTSVGGSENISRPLRALRAGHLDARELVALACECAERVAQGSDGRASIRAARAWLACPCNSHGSAAARAAAAERALHPAARAAAAAARAAEAATEWAEAAAEWAEAAAEWAEAAADNSAVECAWQANRIAEVLCWGLS